MIDVKELRIGNYVFPKNDSGKESVIGEIFAINDYLVSIKRNHNQYDYHLLEPIPPARIPAYFIKYFLHSTISIFNYLNFVAFSN